MRATGPGVDFYPELQLVISLRLWSSGRRYALRGKHPSAQGVNNTSAINGEIWTYLRGDQGGAGLNQIHFWRIICRWSIVISLRCVLVESLRKAALSTCLIFAIWGVWAHGNSSTKVGNSFIRERSVQLDTSHSIHPHLPVQGWTLLAPKKLWHRESQILGQEGQSFLVQLSCVG